jgi:hypothetical protein
MKTRTTWVVLAVAAFLVLAAGGAGAIPAVLAPGDPVAGKINYQGRLTDPGGMPLDGTFPMRFQIYNDPTAGTLQWDSGQVSVNVEKGLFNVGLNVDTADFNGQGLWLRIYVKGEWLSPRQELLPVPYALSLKPGAEVLGSTAAGSLLKVQNSANPSNGSAVWGEAATGTAVYGRSPGGAGLSGYSEDGYAVSGTDAGTSQARGYGGYFSSQNGVGVYGKSSAQTYYTNKYAPGVYGRSANGVGVYGASDGTGGAAYGGLFQGRMGLSARASGPSGEGYAGTFISDNYRGIYALSVAGYYDGYFAGTGGIYAADYWALQADRTVVVNASDETLELGDVVAIAGIVESPKGGEPLLAVRRAEAAQSGAVVGVVVQAMRVDIIKPEGMDGAEFLDVQPVEGSVPAKGYLAIVTHGLIPAVKAAEGSLQIGDLLTISATPGAVCKAGPGSSGAILGKVAGPVDTKSGTVPVFVVLQ